LHFKDSCGAGKSWALKLLIDADEKLEKQCIKKQNESHDRKNVVPQKHAQSFLQKNGKKILAISAIATIGYGLWKYMFNAQPTVVKLYR
jgi:hypothetical protein